MSARNDIRYVVECFDGSYYMGSQNLDAGKLAKSLRRAWWFTSMAMAKSCNVVMKMRGFNSQVVTIKIKYLSNGAYSIVRVHDTAK